MPLRVSGSLTKRLDALTRVARKSDLDQRYQLATVLGSQVLTEPDMAELTLWQRTVLSWPRIIHDVDEWSALAEQGQADLARETGEWLGPPNVVSSTIDPDDVSHRYKPNPSQVKP